MTQYDDSLLKKIQSESDDFSFLDINIKPKEIKHDGLNNIKIPIENIKTDNINISQQEENKIEKDIKSISNNKTNKESDFTEEKLKQELDNFNKTNTTTNKLKSTLINLKEKIADGIIFSKGNYFENWKTIVLIFFIIIVSIVGTYWYYIESKKDDVKGNYAYKADLLNNSDKAVLLEYTYSGVLQEKYLQKYNDKNNKTIKLGDILGIGINYYFLQSNKIINTNDLIEYDVAALMQKKICKEYIQYIDTIKTKTIEYKDIGKEFQNLIKDKINISIIGEKIDNFNLATNEFISCLNENNVKEKLEIYKTKNINIEEINTIINKIILKDKKVDELKNNIKEIEKLTNELWGNEKTILPTQENTLTASLGIEVNDKDMSFILKNGDKLPKSSTKIYRTRSPYQQLMYFDIYQGEDKIAKNNKKLGRLTITGLKPIAHTGQRVEVKLTINEEGLLSIQAIDLVNPELKVETNIEKGYDFMSQIDGNIDLIIDFGKKIASITKVTDDNINDLMKKSN